MICSSARFCSEIKDRRGIPILFLANKMDVRDAASAVEVCIFTACSVNNFNSI